MKVKYVLIFITLLMPNIIFCQEYKASLSKADKYFKKGKKKEAKKLYLKAAKLGSADAHFALAYTYIVTKKEAIYHYSEAAKLGHSEALDNALEHLLFRANSLTNANPWKALEIYKMAKKVNPLIKIYNEENKINIIKKCAEVEPFNGKKFIKKYKLNNDKNKENGYYIWELAEEASKGGRFGKPDPTLIFQLIIHGGDVPAELRYAVKDYYEYWKKGIVKEFNLCNYVTSGSGMSYCSARAEEKANIEFQNEIKEIKKNINKNAKSYLEPAYKAAIKFIKNKAWNEEGHDGSGYQAWTRDSIYEQKTNFMNTIQRISKGFLPKNVKSLKSNDKDLNKTYKKIINKLKKKPISGMKFRITYKDVRAVQRLWIPYRDRCADLFIQLASKTKKEFWKSWFTRIRINQLNSISKLGY